MCSNIMCCPFIQTHTIKDGTSNTLVLYSKVLPLTDPDTTSHGCLFKFISMHASHCHQALKMSYLYHADVISLSTNINIAFMIKNIDLRLYYYLIRY